MPRAAWLLSARAAAIALLATVCGGCGSDEEERELASAAASQREEPSPLSVPPVVARRATAEPNPLSLPPRKLELADGARVFTVPEPMLRGAKLGSAFALRAATVVGRDGDDILVDGREGPNYKVHPAYVIPLVPPPRPPKIETPVLAEWGGALRHGVVRRYVKDKVMVRFTDTSDKTDRQLSREQIMVQKEGFHPGSYAVRQVGADYAHVMLVSPLGDGTTGEWLAIGWGGATQTVAEKDLLAVPVTFLPKVGSLVWAEHLGKMREGTVVEVDRPGLLTVKFERAGRAVVVGWGRVMPPAKR